MIDRDTPTKDNHKIPNIKSLLKHSSKSKSNLFYLGRVSIFNMNKIKYSFITGTRADFGKLKNLISLISQKNQVNIVVTGMHLLDEFGSTIIEIEKAFPGLIHKVEGQKYKENMALGFARFIKNFHEYLNEERPDVVVVHGDRFDALGGYYCIK